MLCFEEGAVAAIVAVLILVFFGAGFVIFLTRYFLRSPYNIRQTVVAWINLCLTRILWRVEDVGQLPERNGDGGVLFSRCTGHGVLPATVETGMVGYCLAVALGTVGCLRRSKRGWWCTA